MRLVKIGLMVLVSMSVLAYAAADDGKPFAQIALEIAKKEMKEEEWKKHCKRAMDRYEQWNKDNNIGDLNQFLNDKLLEIAPSVKSGKIDALKKFVFWLALYQEFKQLPPEYIREVKPEHRQQLEELLKDFQWERMSEMIRENVKRYDEEKENKKGEKSK